MCEVPFCLSGLGRERKDVWLMLKQIRDRLIENRFQFGLIHVNVCRLESLEGVEITLGLLHN